MRRGAREVGVLPHDTSDDFITVYDSRSCCAAGTSSSVKNERYGRSPGSASVIGGLSETSLQDCVAAFRGQLAPGAVCDASKLPDMGFVPCKAGTCKNGTCSAYLAAGAACDPTQNNLAAAGCNFPDGYTCTGTGTVGTCVKRGAVGDVCDTKSSGFSCESMACGLDGKCMAPPADLLCKGG
ncbi:MAG TPA: hypothetical protein VF316_22355 [Polyangiaceae bacterium]